MVLHLWIPSTVKLLALCTMEPPRIDNHSNSAHCAGFGWLDAREKGVVQGSNPPQTQSQSKGLFSLQSSSNLAQNPVPPTSNQGCTRILMHVRCETRAQDEQCCKTD